MASVYSIEKIGAGTKIETGTDGTKIETGTDTDERKRMRSRSIV